MPIATRPCTARSSRLPSSTFAASTVLEKPKLTANASASTGESQPPSTATATPMMPVKKRCEIAVPQTS